MFAVKQGPDGTVHRLKARFVARGFTQQQGLDYDGNFSPVAKLNTVRVLISLAVHRHWALHQLDVKNAFLNGDLQEIVYMQQPPGFETTGVSLVCCLNKSLYGLKQSLRAWFDKFSKIVSDVGFTRSSAEFSLFTRHRPTGTVILLVYVDDILITGDDLPGIRMIKQHLATVFQTKDLVNLRYFLGLKVARRPDGLVLSQRKYCLDLFHDAGYSGCKPADTPMDINHMLCAHASDSDLLLPNPEYYRRLVGKLIYLTVTRPDISFVVGVAVGRILRYLKTAPGQGLVYNPSSSPLSLIAYSDVAYACSLDDRFSTSGYCTYFGGHLITWRSKKQFVVARSSAESEYRSMTTVLYELTWLEGLLYDLGVKLSSPATLFCDSQAAIHIAKNLVFHERTKHIEVDCHFIREKVQLKKIELTHVPAAQQAYKRVGGMKHNGDVGRGVIGVSDITYMMCFATSSPLSRFALLLGLHSLLAWTQTLGLLIAIARLPAHSARLAAGLQSAKALLAACLALLQATTLQVVVARLVAASPVRSYPSRNFYCPQLLHAIASPDRSFSKPQLLFSRP
ncbi:hypothetical protein KSP39_PZI012592 [Platanthera zijinensis]|uniref:Reverse transcriptase Ty1/copia-type domain-containing protein n=1 Tax=Platanthera zijinensis TaxID=2320716 RepID=A0AAP0BEA1_9ASPA